MELQQDNDLIIIKRKTKHNYKLMAVKPLLKFSGNGRFFLSNEAAKIVGVSKGEGIMFAFNMQEKTAYIFKDDDENSFILRQREKEHRFNFTSQELGEYFYKCFQPFTLPALFNIGEMVIKRGITMYQINLK